MRFERAFALGVIGAAAGVIGLIAACSSDSTNAGTAPTGTPDAGSATCTAPGSVTSGPADTHCAGKVQTVNQASCTVTDAGAGDDDDQADAVDAGDAGKAGDDDDDCDYGATMYGLSGSDDDCKYDVSYVVDTPICEGTGGVQFTVSVKNATDGQAVSGIPNGIVIEAYIPTTPNPACDNATTHPSPKPTNLLEVDGKPGTYTGPVVFDAPGIWTVRFHIHEECADVLDDSPHGHAAFHITVP